MLTELFYPYAKGGAERRYAEIAKRLAKKHEVTVYSLHMLGVEKEEVWNNVTIRRVGIKFNPNKRPRYLIASYLPAFIKSLKRDYDIIDANQGFATLIGYFKKFTERPLVATFHDLYMRRWFRFPFFQSIAGMCLEKLWKYANFDLIFANSSETKRKLLSAGFKSRIEVVPSGIDLERIQRVHAKKEDVIVYVGRLEHYKRVDILLDAAKELEYEIHIIGAGSMEQVLRRRAPKNVKFLGFLSEEEKIKEMRKAKVLVNPSELEGFGLVLLEAMACETLPIARDLACYRDFANEKNAILIKEMDAEKLANAIRYAMEHWHEYRDALLITAKRFDWDGITKIVERYYEKLLECV